MKFHRIVCACVSLALASNSIGIAAAQSAAGSTFKDVKPGDFGFEAVEYLKAQGVLGGYDDNTFRPMQKVNRAEAAKIIASPFMTDAEQQKIGKTAYADIPATAWYIPYVEWGRQQLGIFDSPPKAASFHPERSVTKAEFLKLMLIANNVDPNSYSEVKLALSPDTNTTDWYYPYLRYAASASIVIPDTSERFGLSRELTRIDVAVLLYRFYQYKDGKRTQFLLDQAQQNLILTLNALERSDVKEAGYASARALLSARGANAKASTEPLVKSVVKLSEGYRALVRAYQAGIDGKRDDVVKLSRDAWNLGDQATKLDASVTAVGKQLEGYATNLANSARSSK